MKVLGKCIEGRKLLPLLAVLIGVVVLAATAGGRTTQTPRASSNSDVSYTPPKCNGSSDLVDAADAIVGSGNSTMYPAAKRLYEQVIASGSPEDRACAAGGLAQLLVTEDAEATDDADKATWEQKLEKSWTRWTKSTINPLKDEFLATVGLLVLLLVISRLLTGAVVRPGSTAPGEVYRRAWWMTGMLLVTAASLSPVVAARWSLEKSSWWPISVGVATVVLVATFMPWRNMHWHRAIIAIGFAGVVAAAFAAPRFDANLLLVAGVWLAVLGVALVAFARGSALAIEVQARGASGGQNASTATFLVARLQELGAKDPRNIRVIDVSDVTSLPEDALTAVPTGALASAIFSVLKVVRPAAPWRITVTQPDDATLVMEITRNRSALPDGSLMVTVDDLPKATPAKKATDDAKKVADGAKDRGLDDLLTIAAAHTLLVLKDPHIPLRHGLCGADDWRALAFHAMALRPGTPPERKSALLHASVDASPRYLLPRMALVNEIDDADVAGRVKYAVEITKLWEDFPKELGTDDKPANVEKGYEAAQLRMLYNRAVAWANVRTDCAIDNNKVGAEEAWEASIVPALRLDTRLEALEENTPSGLARLVEASKRPVAYLLLDLKEHAPAEACPESEIEARANKWLPRLERDLAPHNRNDYYARACFLAGHKKRPDEWKKALADLDIAGTDSRFATWALKDPSLAVFGLGDEYGSRAEDTLVETFKRTLTPKPPASYLELDLFAPYAAALKAYGLTELTDLLGVTCEDLASTTKVHPAIAQRWLDAAGLEDHLRRRGEANAGTRRQLLDVLLSIDVVSRQQLAAKLAGSDTQREEFYIDMVKAALTSRIVPTRDQTIKAWTRLA